MTFWDVQPEAWGAIVVAIIAPLGAYLAAVRKTSGKIGSSDAEQLWKESSDIRRWSTERVKELNDHVDQLERRLAEIEKANGQLAEDNRRLTRENYELNIANRELVTQNTSLTTLLDQERVKVQHLQWEAEHMPRRRNGDPPVDQDDEAPGGSDDDNT